MKKLNLLFTALLLMCYVGTAKAVEVSIDGIKYDVITKAKQATVIKGNYSGNIVIPSEITYNNVTYSVTSIGKSAFEGCYGLTSITIPNSVTSIGDRAFSYCSGLTSITIPNSVTSIGNYAFYDCSGLTSITIPNSVTSIGNYAFYDRSGLESIVVDPGNTKYDSRENCNAIIETESNTLIKGCNNSVIPNSVTSIGDYAFNNCSRLTSITIPNSVTSIGNEAFLGCDGLTSITIGNSVTSIGNSAFSSCSGLTSITIPNSVTSIGHQAFSSCSGLTSITIGNSVTSIGSSAFAGCSGLTSITIPSSVTSIGNWAFEGCSGLTSITIPNSVTRIGNKAFNNCENLADVYCLATDVPATRDDWGDYCNPFEGSYPEYMTLHVPAEAINSYKTTAPWSSFGHIVTLDGEVVETPVCATPVISYNNYKLIIDCETEGAEFVTKVTSSDFDTFYDAQIDFSATYNISVYAMATGYDNSDTVNATLCWIENGNIDNETNVINIPATAVLITSSNGTLSINCSLDGESVEIYTTSGTFIGTTSIVNGNATIQTGLAKGSVAIVKIGNKSVKVILN